MGIPVAVKPFFHGPPLGWSLVLLGVLLGGYGTMTAYQMGRASLLPAVAECKARADSLEKHLLAWVPGSRLAWIAPRTARTERIPPYQRPPNVLHRELRRLHVEESE
jgi:hypothetical protein